MARFTADPGEIAHLREIEHQLYATAFQHRWRLKVVLGNGQVIAGYFGGSSSGKSGRQERHRAYCGNVILVEDTGTIHILDKLDITRVDPP